MFIVPCSLLIDLPAGDRLALSESCHGEVVQRNCLRRGADFETDFRFEFAVRGGKFSCDLEQVIVVEAEDNLHVVTFAVNKFAVGDAVTISTANVNCSMRYPVDFHGLQFLTPSR